MLSTPWKVKDITFPSGKTVKYFIGGSGLNHADAFKRCHDEGGSVMNFDSLQDLWALYEKEGLFDVRGSAIWLPWVSLQVKNGVYTVSNPRKDFKPRPGWKYTWYDGNNFYDNK